MTGAVFRFTSTPPSDGFVARIPTGVSSKRELMRVLARELQLPEYFGHNWDALDECLRDFSWISSLRVVIVHNDLPNLPSQDRHEYLDILRRAVLASPEHEVVVVFPKSTRKVVSEALRTSES